MLRQIISGLVVLAAVLLPSKTVDAAAAINPLVSCEDITDADNNETFTVCASSSFTTPSPGQFENGTTVYIGGWNYYFNIFHPLAEGLVDGSPRFPNEAALNMVVHVYRSDTNDCNVNVTTDGITETCASCEFCGGNNETDIESTEYSADCTNIENGRNVICESTTILYFPLTGAAIPNITLTDDGSPPPLLPSNDTTSTDGNGTTIAPPPSSTGYASKTNNMSIVLLNMMISGLIVLTMV